MKIDPIVKDILQELKFNPNECLWEKHGATCMKHRYIEIAGQEKGVVIESLDEVEKNSAEGVVAIKSYNQGDCKNFLVKTLKMSFHKKPMATDEVIAHESTNKKWKKPALNSASAKILKFVCAR